MTAAHRPLRLVVPGLDPASTEPGDDPAIVSAPAPAARPAAAEPESSGDPGAAPALTVPVVPVVARAGLIGRHWLSLAAGGWRHWTTRPGTAFTDEPPSLAHIAAYYAAAPWVPSGHDGSLLPAAGRLYGRAVALPVVAALYGLAWIFARPFRLGVALTLAGAVTAAAWLH